MRRLLAVVAGMVAVVAALVTLPTAWVATHVADEDGYVSFTSPLAADPELQRGFADYLSDELVRRTSLPSPLRKTTADLIVRATERAANQPGFTQAWEETQRRSHRQLFQAGAADRLTVDLGPLATFVTKRFSTELPAGVRAPETIVVPVKSGPDRRAIEQVEATPGHARVGGVVIAATVLVVLVMARRRSTALVWLGLAAALVAGTLRGATDRVVPSILDRTDAPSEFARTLQKLLADRAAESLGVWLAGVAVGGAAAMVLGLLGRLASGRRS